MTMVSRRITFDAQHSSKRKPLPHKKSVAAARAPVAAASGGLDPDNTTVLVCGGAGVGLEVVKQLLDVGCWVTQICRSPGAFTSEIEKRGGMTRSQDVLDQAAVASIMDSIDDLDVVISTVGGSPTNPAADGMGNSNIIEAAKARGIKRFVLVTSIGTGDSKDAPPAEVYKVLEPVLLEKAKAEERLKASGMDYTIIRPGGLKSEPATGTGILTEDITICGAICRQDVAKLVTKCLWSGAAVCKTLSAVDTEQVGGEQKFKTFEC